MSDLNNIRLSETVIAALYKDTLIALDDIKIKDEGVRKETAPVEKTTVQAPVTPAIPQPSEQETETTAPLVNTQKGLPANGEKWFLGDNAKGIAILVQDNNNVYLPDEHLQLLSSILAACKLNLGDVAIINHLQRPYTYREIKSLTQVRYCLLFNVTTQSVQLPLTFPMYQIQSYDNCTFLSAADLSAMTGATQEAKLEKSKLWLCLKQIFLS